MTVVAWTILTDLFVPEVHGMHSSLLQHHNSKLSIVLSAFLIVQDSQLYSTTGKTNAFTSRSCYLLYIFVFPYLV